MNTLSLPAESNGNAVLSISDSEFRLFSAMIYRIAGISMGPAKKPLVASRLMKRVKHFGLASYADYFHLISEAEQAEELQVAVDLLTTNETYFFREQKHFDFLQQTIIPSLPPGQVLNVWSAACSSGEEPYSVAMLAAQVMGSDRYRVMASDLSTRVLEQAEQGIYPLSRTMNIPDNLLKKYCLKGIGSQDGKLMVDPELKRHVQFFQHNLNSSLPGQHAFDLILLRNVLIYFDADTKRRVIQHLLPSLKAGGYLFISHSESLNGISHGLQMVKPAIYRKAL